MSIAGINEGENRFVTLYGNASASRVRMRVGEWTGSITWLTSATSVQTNNDTDGNQMSVFSVDTDKFVNVWSDSSAGGRAVASYAEYASGNITFPFDLLVYDVPAGSIRVFGIDGAHLGDAGLNELFVLSSCDYDANIVSASIGEYKPEILVEEPHPDEIKPAATRTNMYSGDGEARYAYNMGNNKYFVVWTPDHDKVYVRILEYSGDLEYNAPDDTASIKYLTNNTELPLSSGATAHSISSGHFKDDIYWISGTWNNLAAHVYFFKYNNDDGGVENAGTISWVSRIDMPTAWQGDPAPVSYIGDDSFIVCTNDEIDPEAGYLRSAKWNNDYSGTDFSGTITWLSSWINFSNVRMIDIDTLKLQENYFVIAWIDDDAGRSVNLSVKSVNTTSGAITTEISNTVIFSSTDWASAVNLQVLNEQESIFSLSFLSRPAGTFAPDDYIEHLRIMQFDEASGTIKYYTDWYSTSVNYLISARPGLYIKYVGNNKFMTTHIYKSSLEMWAKIIEYNSDWNGTDNSGTFTETVSEQLTYPTVESLNDIISYVNSLITSGDDVGIATTYLEYSSSSNYYLNSRVWQFFPEVEAQEVEIQNIPTYELYGKAKIRAVTEAIKIDEHGDIPHIKYLENGYFLAAWMPELGVDPERPPKCSIGRYYNGEIFWVLQNQAIPCWASGEIHFLKTAYLGDYYIAFVAEDDPFEVLISIGKFNPNTSTLTFPVYQSTLSSSHGDYLEIEPINNSQFVKENEYGFVVIFANSSNAYIRIGKFNSVSDSIHWVTSAYVYNGGAWATEYPSMVIFRDQKNIAITARDRGTSNYERIFVYQYNEDWDGTENSGTFSYRSDTYPNQNQTNWVGRDNAAALVDNDVVLWAWLNESDSPDQAYISAWKSNHLNSDISWFFQQSFYPIPEPIRLTPNDGQRNQYNLDLIRLTGNTFVVAYSSDTDVNALEWDTFYLRVGELNDGKIVWLTNPLPVSDIINTTTNDSFVGITLTRVDESTFAIAWGKGTALNRESMYIQIYKYIRPVGVIENVAYAGQKASMVFAGKLRGYYGLTEGEEYYVDGHTGRLQKTGNLKFAKAISEDELQITE
jgi:hypothetical protein